MLLFAWLSNKSNHNFLCWHKATHTHIFQTSTLTLTHKCAPLPAQVKDDDCSCMFGKLTHNTSIDSSVVLMSLFLLSGFPLHPSLFYKCASTFSFSSLVHICHYYPSGPILCSPNLFVFYITSISSLPFSVSFRFLILLFLLLIWFILLLCTSLPLISCCNHHTSNHHFTHLSIIIIYLAASYLLSTI